mmetsp:Transcript_8681/g.20586  ORF Transcript_8681/g.20586 Transcript_8681/m.20586 type:complete len:471 (+) Transcript_8681:136-1548(+)
MAGLTIDAPPRGMGEEQFTSFKLGRHIGTGGFGQVFSGLDRSGETVAVKIMDASSRHTALEAALASRVSHPFIMPAVDVEVKGARVAMAMPLARGDLLDHILDAGRLSDEEAAHHVACAAVAVDALASAGIAHRDIKPENLLLLEGRTLLTDVGAAWVREPALARSGDCARSCCLHCAARRERGGASGSDAKASGAGAAQPRAFSPAGSVTYAAPEVFARFGQPIRDMPLHAADEGYNPFAADVWSLGVLIYVTTTGRAPWEEPAECDVRFAAHAQGRLLKPKAMSHEAWHLFQAATALNPAHRPKASDLLTHQWLADAAFKAVVSVGGAEALGLPHGLAANVLDDVETGAYGIAPMCAACGVSTEAASATGPACSSTELETEWFFGELELDDLQDVSDAGLGFTAPSPSSDVGSASPDGGAAATANVCPVQATHALDVCGLSPPDDGGLVFGGSFESFTGRWVRDGALG